MNFDLSDDQLAIRDAVEAICADFGADYWLERDRDGRWPSEFCDAVARGGWFGVTMPEEHGGAGREAAAIRWWMPTEPGKRRQRWRPAICLSTAARWCAEPLHARTAMIV